MFNFLKYDLQETEIAYRAGKSKITELEQKLVKIEKDVSNFDMTNKLFIEQRGTVVENSSNCNKILENWSRSHQDIYKIMDFQIPFQCAKILGGNTKEATDRLKSQKTNLGFLILLNLLKISKISLFQIHTLIKLLLINTVLLVLMVLLNAN